MTKNKKVLVIDDDFDVRTLMQIMMESNGYEVHLAENGEIGFETLINNQPDSFCAVFLDILMPDMNGLDVLVKLKSHAETQNVPVIMVTTEGMNDQIIRGYNLGASYYIPKPFTAKQLIYGLNSL